MKKILFKLFIVFNITSILLVSCKKMDEGETDPSKKSNPNRTVIVYMVANNDLYNNAVKNINEMERAWSNFDGNLIVYISPRNASPYFMKIEHDQSNEIISKVVRTYPKQNSCEVETMQKVYNDIMTMYPADSYGTILWSHATGWLPSNIPNLLTSPTISYTEGSTIPQLKSFGDDGGYKMEIADLAKALPAGLDFIIFDACLMANVESIYELKDKADYILASSTEILEMGFPYSTMLPALFSQDTEEVFLKKIAEEYFNYYNGMSGIAQSASISLIKTDEIEKLAQICHTIININEPLVINQGKIQNLDTWGKTIFFDFSDFMKNVYSSADFSEFDKQMDNVIVYKNNTPWFYNKFPIMRHSGLSTSIPCELPNNNLKAAYKQTMWSQVTGVNSLLQ